MDDYEDFDDKQNTYPSEKSLAKLHKQVRCTCVWGPWTLNARRQFTPVVHSTLLGRLISPLYQHLWDCVCVFVYKGDLCGPEAQQDSCPVADAPAAGHPPGRRGQK